MSQLTDSVALLQPKVPEQKILSYSRRDSTFQRAVLGSHIQRVACQYHRSALEVFLLRPAAFVGRGDQREVSTDTVAAAFPRGHVATVTLALVSSSIPHRLRSPW
jgi:hypothetical protein